MFCLSRSKNGDSISMKLFQFAKNGMGRGEHVRATAVKGPANSIQLINTTVVIYGVIYNKH